VVVPHGQSQMQKQQPPHLCGMQVRTSIFAPLSSRHHAWNHNGASGSCAIVGVSARSCVRRKTFSARSKPCGGSTAGSPAGLVAATPAEPGEAAEATGVSFWQRLTDPLWRLAGAGWQPPAPPVDLPLPVDKLTCKMAARWGRCDFSSIRARSLASALAERTIKGNVCQKRRVSSATACLALRLPRTQWDTVNELRLLEALCRQCYCVGTR